MIELGETAVRSALTTQWIGHPYRYFASVPSTNDLLKEQIRDAASTLPAGTVFLTDYQSQGRGRLNRRWLAPAGSSLLLSVLFWPDWPTEQAHWLTMLTSLAAAEAMETVTGTTVGVKWPNDLMIWPKDGWRKVGGLLLEGGMGEDGRLQHAIMGIGLNVNIPPAQLPDAAVPATSLLAAGGQSISRLLLLAAFLQRLETRYELADGGQSPQPDWNQRLITLGERVQATNLGGERPIMGIAEGTDGWGRLLVRGDDGRLHTIAAGDVTLR